MAAGASTGHFSAPDAGREADGVIAAAFGTRLPLLEGDLYGEPELLNALFPEAPRLFGAGVAHPIASPLSNATSTSSIN